MKINFARVLRVSSFIVAGAAAVAVLSPIGAHAAAIGGMGGPLGFGGGGGGAAVQIGPGGAALNLGGGLGNVVIGAGGVNAGGFLGGLLDFLGIGGAIGGGGYTACGAGTSTIGGVMCNVVESVQDVPGLLTGFSYLVGLILGAMGIAKLYEHVQDPRQHPVWDAIKRFIAGGALFALPMVMEAAQNTLTAATDMSATETGFNVTGVSGAGLDAMIVALMADIWVPFANLLWAFCYLAGIVLVIVGIMRMIKSAQDGPRGPGGFGTIMTFITAGALFSADSMMGAWTESLFFSGGDITTFADLAYTTGMDPAAVDRINSVISAVLAFMMVLGWISFIRGWFIIRHVAEGDHQASLTAGLTHLFGGALAVNLGPVMNAVQETFGLSAYGVNFT